VHLKLQLYHLDDPALNTYRFTLDRPAGEPFWISVEKIVLLQQITLGLRDDTRVTACIPCDPYVQRGHLYALYAIEILTPTVFA